MLSIILPTYNEAANVAELLSRLTKALGSEEHEIIIVDDDSPDKTWQVAEGLKKQYPRLKVLRRIGRKGLSSAVKEGCDMAKGDILITMDSDLQHDPALVLSLAQKIREGADIAVASRYIEGGSVGEWVKGRRLLSRTGTFLARMLPPVHVSDPLSGFFAVNADAYRKVASSLRPAGFKILLEILAFLPPSSKAAEVPLVFNMREHGESKLSFSVETVFLWQLLRIALRRIQRPLFWLVTLAMVVVFGLRLSFIAPLYLDSNLRSSVQSTLTRIVDERGWLMSDIAIENVEADWVEFDYHHHHFGDDETSCMRASLSSDDIEPCTD